MSQYDARVLRALEPYTQHAETACDVLSALVNTSFYHVNFSLFPVGGQEPLELGKRTLSQFVEHVQEQTDVLLDPETAELEREAVAAGLKEQVEAVAGGLIERFAFVLRAIKGVYVRTDAIPAAKRDEVVAQTLFDIAVALGLHARFKQLDWDAERLLMRWATAHEEEHRRLLGNEDIVLLHIVKDGAGDPAFFIPVSSPLFLCLGDFLAGEESADDEDERPRFHRLLRRMAREDSTDSAPDCPLFAFNQVRDYIEIIRFVDVPLGVFHWYLHKVFLAKDDFVSDYPDGGVHHINGGSCLVFMVYTTVSGLGSWP